MLPQLPLREAVGSGADIPVLPQKTPLVLVEAGSRRRNRGSLPRAGDHVGEGNGGVAERNAHRMLVELFKAGVARKEPRRRERTEPAVHRGDHVVRAHDGTVVEAHAFPQVEGEGLRVAARLEALAQFRHRLRAGIEREQLFPHGARRDLPRDERRGAVQVERGRLLYHRYVELAAVQSPRHAPPAAAQSRSRRGRQHKNTQFRHIRLQSSA